jgi:Asp-tRNA(Asn)/Glu-tRNA(Gln) amidotransferase A subunit family amidase
MIAAKEVKPSEVMQAVLNRIDKVNPQINAFCTVDPDRAMAEAREADKRGFHPCPLLLLRSVWAEASVRAHPFLAPPRQLEYVEP